MRGVRASIVGILMPAVALCGSDEARDAVSGPPMLHKAVAAYRGADVKGMDILEPGVLLMASNGIKHAGSPALDASLCDPQHEQFNREQCSARFENAHAYLDQSE